MGEEKEQLQEQDLQRGRLWSKTSKDWFRGLSAIRPHCCWGWQR